MQNNKRFVIFAIETNSLRSRIRTEFNTQPIGLLICDNQ